MSKEDMIILCQVYETIEQLEDIVEAIQGEVYVSTLGKGVIGRLSLIEKVILNHTIAELRDDCIEDTHCSGLYILGDKRLSIDEKVDYLTGEKSIKNYIYKIY